MQKQLAIQRMPLYQQVTAALREQIRLKRPGDHLGTESGFVKKFGVSLVTIRRALRDLEMEGLVQRVQGSGTFVSDEPLAKRHVGVMLDADPTHPRLSPFFPALMRSIRLKLREAGISSREYTGFSAPTLHKDGALSCEDVLEDVRLGRLEALVCFYTQRHESWYREVLSRGIPVLDSSYCWERGWFSKTEFLKKAFTHFQQRGRRKLAVLAWENPEILFTPFHQDICALAPQYGIELENRLLDFSAEAWEIGMGWERFRDLWLSGREKPDSLIILDDMLFDDCQKAIDELRVSVPESLDVLVYTSDAMKLKPHFPVHVYRTGVDAAAERFVGVLRTMLGHGCGSVTPEIINEIRLVAPDALETIKKDNSPELLPT